MHHTSRLPLLALPFCLPVIACSDDGGDETAMVGEGSTSTGTPPGTTTQMPPATTTTGMEGTSTTMTPGTSSSGVDSSSSDDGPPPIIFDQGIPDSPPFESECGKVDFLFVIDNSGSMSDEQLTLINNFPAFINGIQATLENVDTIHVGVTTTDDYFPNVAGCNTISGLVVQTGGFDSSMAMCGPYEEGANYMTEMDDLDVAFACAAQVGTEGSSSERPMQAAVDGITGVLGDNDECNEGFIREDALMVLVIITDESDISSPGTPMSWYDDIVAAKAGIPENVVVVSLINTPGGICAFDFAVGIADFTMMFGPNGFMADICQPDFAPIFDQAVGIIDIACENYIPPD
jgi:hypothetical protein